MEPQKPANSPGPGPEVLEKQKAVKEQAAPKVHSWTMQKEMRNVLGRVPTSAAGRILDSANSRDVKA